LATLEKNWQPRFFEDDVRVARLGKELIIDVRDSAQRHWLFFQEVETSYEEHPELLALVIVVLLSILVASYFAIRFMLSPLREIERGVAEVAKGDLNVKLESRGHNELASLARSFNTMTAQVRTMVLAKQQLLLDVSHEFRSPLTRMKVAMELSGEEARESIQRSIQDLETMLSELLESARMDNPSGQLRLQPLELNVMLEELTGLYEGRAPGLKLRLPAGRCLLHADPARLQIALRNLVDNAMKYSETQSQPVEVELQMAPDALAVWVRIQDFGQGISLEQQSLIFEPFYRVDRSRMKTTGGYGLGLSLARKIILAHSGQLNVKSQVGHGATFTVELPLV
jgi:signal transduction histidine kinase